MSNVDFAVILQTDVTQAEACCDAAALRILTKPRGKETTNMHPERSLLTAPTKHVC